MLRPFLVAIACLSLAACSVGGEGEPAPPPASAPAEGDEDGTGPTETGEPPADEPGAEPVALVPLRPAARRRCQRLRDLAPLCPRVVPEGRFGPGSGAYNAASHSGFRQPGASAFSLQQGGEHPGRPELDRPPATVHVVVSARPPFRTPVPRRVELRDGLLEERRRTVLFLGRARWGGRDGVLLLEPPFPRGGLEANHLVFRWAVGSRSVSLHGWEPFTEVPDVLRAVVESIPPR